MTEWNLASEILPDVNERVLVYGEYPVYKTGKEYKRGITIGKYSYIAQKWECENFIGNRVIAWAKLPEAPKEV